MYPPSLDIYKKVGVGGDLTENVIVGVLKWAKNLQWSFNAEKRDLVHIS